MGVTQGIELPRRAKAQRPIGRVQRRKGLSGPWRVDAPEHLSDSNLEGSRRQQIELTA